MSDTARLKQARIVRDTDVQAIIERHVLEITRLRAELAEARAKAFEEAAVVMENLSFFTDIADLIGMTKQEMSERTCHEGAQAIRAMIDKG